MKYWQNRKVIVTGGAGFVGKRTVDMLTNYGAIVTSVISPRHDLSAFVPKKRNESNLRVVQLDLMDCEKTLAYIRDCEILLHFAAIDGGMIFKKQHPAEIFRKNTVMTGNVLEACRVNGINRLFLMSSIEVYFPTDRVNLKEEKMYSGKLYAADDGYAWSKRFSEIMAKLYIKEYGMTISIARAGNIYGPEDDPQDIKGRVIPSFIRRALSGENIVIFGNGQRQIPFLYIDDAVESIISLTENYATGDPVNLVSAKRISIRNLAEKIIKICKSKSAIVFSDKQNESRISRISINKIRKVIKYRESTTLDKGLMNTVDYYKHYEKK